MLKNNPTCEASQVGFCYRSLFRFDVHNLGIGGSGCAVAAQGADLIVISLARRRVVIPLECCVNCVNKLVRTVLAGGTVNFILRGTPDSIPG